MQKIPIIGFGTWEITGQTCTEAVEAALKMGYRHIDTADAYGNHKEVGKGIKKSGVPREKIFLTSKVWYDKLHHDEVISSAERFLKELQTDYLDLLLIHWPNPAVPIKETLSAMQELQKQKKVRTIGVSNFTIPFLKEALATKIPLMNLQVEFHPSFYQKELKKFCDKNELVLTAYSPIGHGHDLKIPLIQDLAKKYEKTPSQIILSWLIQKNIVVIPRSSSPERIKENLDATVFTLKAEDSAKIDALKEQQRQINPSWAVFDRS